MSDRSRCNFCLYRDFERVAESRRHMVSTRPAALDGFPDGVDVFIHPTNYIPPTRRQPANLEDASNYPPPSVIGTASSWWAAWFAKLPTACCCRG